MSALSEIDRDLDQITVNAAHLAQVRSAVRTRIPLETVDADLAALANGHAVERPRRVAAASREEEAAPPSGAVEVSDAELASAELPAVLAVEPAPVHEPLALDLEPGELGPEPADEGAEPVELAPERTSAGVVFPTEPGASAELGGAAEPVAEAATGALLDDPDADFAALLGESDPMRDEGAAPLSMGEIEPEATMMFTAEDAARYSRPAPPMDDEADEESVELDIDEDMIELEEDESPAPASAAPPPRTAPPPPPRTAPPPSPSQAPPRGFLGKILQRKP